MPPGGGGQQHGRVVMIADVGGAWAVDAPFAQLITARNGRITALQQIADTVRWHIPT